MNNKQKELMQLRKKIITDCFIKRGDEVWFYGEWNGVKGYLGTDPILFVGLNPSTGTFPSKADKFFYNHLKTQGLKNAHITDLIKIRMKNTDTEKNIKKHILNQIKFVRQEIRVIKPKVIVALGHDCEKKLKKNNIQNVKYLMHYCYPFGRGRKEIGKNKKKFYVQLKEIKKAYS